MEILSDLVESSEASPVEQNTGNLNGIANVLANVANFVNESNIQINETVSYCSCVLDNNTMHVQNQIIITRSFRLSKVSSMY